MAVRIANLAKTIDFIWDQDPDKDNPAKASVFELGFLDAYDQAYINDRMTTFDGGFRSPVEGETPEEASAASMKNARIEAYKSAVDATQLALKGVRNVLDDEGNPVTLKLVPRNFGTRTRMVADPDFVAAMDVRLCLAIYGRVTQVNKVEEKQRKNLRKAS